MAKSLKSAQPGSKNAKKPGQSAGGSPKDGIDKIIQRQKAEEFARDLKTRAKKAKAISSSTEQVVEEASSALLGVNDLLDGHMTTGHTVAIGDATFGVIEGGHKLTLVAAATGELAKYVGVWQSTYISMHQIVNDIFDQACPLKGMAAKKQLAMWQHIRSTLGNEGLDDLEDRLENDRKVRFETRNEELASAHKAAQFVGSDVEVWERAVSGSDAITAAFEKMTADQPAEVRFGNPGNKDAVNYGVVLGFFFDQGTDCINVYVGHVGDKSEHAGKIVVGAHLRCSSGWVPDTLSESILASYFGNSIKAIHELIMDLEWTKFGREALLSGMIDAVKRIMNDRKTKVVPITKPTFSIVKQPAAAVIVTQTAAVEQPAAPVQAQVTPQVTPHAESDEGLVALIAGMKSGGANDRQIGQAIAAFMSTSSTATKSA